MTKRKRGRKFRLHPRDDNAERWLNWLINGKKREIPILFDETSDGYDKNGEYNEYARE